MKTLKSIVSVILALIITSCSSDDDNGTPQPESRFTGYKFSYQTTTYDINYNEDGDIISFESQDNFGNTILHDIVKNNGQVVSIGPTLFTYNDANQIISIDCGLDNQGTTELTYNASGQLVQQTAYWPGSDFTEYKEFSYTNNKVTTVISNIVTVGLNYYYKSDISYNAQNNISEIVYSTSENGVDYTWEATNMYTYDNKKNPMKLVTDAMDFGAFYIEPSTEFSILNTESFGYRAYYDLAWISNNNIVQMIQDYGTGSYTANYSYTYNSDDYPTEIHYTDGEDDYTLEYFYTEQ